MKRCPNCHGNYTDEVEFCPRDGTRLAAPVDGSEAQLASSLARRFRILRRLGEGGMGTVFLAEQIAVGGRPVALKVLSRKLLDDPEFLLRFQDEAASTGRIRHPNVVTIYESGQSDDGTPYIAMEYLEGETLRHRLRTRGALPARECAEILQQAARGVNAAHKLGIIHRDLKPDNIFLTGGDEGEVVVKVVDFGIAKLRESATHTLTGTVLGTPAYMSYEQASGMRSDQLDSRSDLYSLGVVTYEMLTGRVPFESDTPLGYVRKHTMEEPPPFGVVAPGLPVSPQVEVTVMKALAKDREERYPSVVDFARDFGRAASEAWQGESPKSFATTKRVGPVMPPQEPAGLRGQPSESLAATVTPQPATGVKTSSPLHESKEQARTKGASYAGDAHAASEPAATPHPSPPTPELRPEPKRMLPQPPGSPSRAEQKQKSSRVVVGSLVAAAVVMIVATLAWIYWQSSTKPPGTQQSNPHEETSAPAQSQTQVPAPNPQTNPLSPQPSAVQIVVQTSPNAQVYLDDTFKGQVNHQGRLVIEDPKPGEHTLRLSLVGKKDYEQRVMVAAGKVATVDATLADLLGSIRVQTSPGAEVLLDNSSRGSADETGQLAVQNVTPGSHDLHVSARGKKDLLQSITVLVGQESTIDAMLLDIEKPPVEVTQPRTTTGGAAENQNFNQKCSMCHGVDGKGYSALKTLDFTDPKVQASLTDKEIVETIKNGKKGMAMPAFADKLSDEQIDSLVTYLRSLDSSKKK